MDPQKRAELEAKLRANIKTINEKYPGKLTMSEDDIVKAMFSEERVNFCENNKGRKVTTDPEIRKVVVEDELKMVMPDKYMPAGFKRNFYHVVKHDGSKESREFNKKMFSDIARDDKRGEIARENYIVHCLNQCREIDVTKFGKDVPETEYLEYALNNLDTGGIAMETQHFITDTPEIKINDESKEKYNDLRRVGESAGGAMRESMNYLRSDGFFTFPTAFMSDELLNTIQQEAFLNGFIEYNNQIAMENNKRSVREDISKIQEKKYEAFSTKDFSYVIPENERIKGGFIPRREELLAGIEYLSRLEIPGSMPDMKKYIEGCRDFGSRVEKAGIDISPEQAEAFAKESEKIVLAFIPLRKKYNDPDNKKMADLTEKVFSGVRKFNGFKDAGLTKSLVRFNNEDLKNMEKSDSFKRMETKLAELNDSMAVLKTENKYGQKEELSSQDLFDLRSKIADTLSSAQECSELYGGTLQGKLADNLKNQLSVQLTSLGKAFPGMTLDQALDQENLTMDMTGHKFEKKGGELSERAKMTITGPDGRQIKGYFTEGKTLDMDETKERIIDKLGEKYPGMKEIAEEMAEHFFSAEPGRPSNDDFISGLKEGLNSDELKTFDKLQSDFNAQYSEFVKVKNGYIADLGDVSDTGIENRNIAMSDVAELLDASGLIAKSRKMTLINDGKKIEGCFMENAEGDQIPDITDNANHFTHIKSDYLDNSKALKQMADLQVLDFICGNVDRHAKNIMFQFNDKNKVTGIVGIDNDYSFCAKESKDVVRENDCFIRPKDMAYISKSMADKVKNLDPNALKVVLNQNKISAAGVDKAVERLNEMKQAIDANVVKVIPDEKFAKYSLQTLAMGDKKSIFRNVQAAVKHMVLDVPEDQRGLQSDEIEAEPKVNALESFAGIRASMVQQNSKGVSDLLNQVTDAQKKVYFGSKKFEKVQRCLTELNKYQKSFEGKQLLSITEAKQYNNTFKMTEKFCQDYLDTKPGDISQYSEKTQKRIKAIQATQKFCRERIKVLNNTLAPKDEILQMKEESDRLQTEFFKDHPKEAGTLLKSLVDMSKKSAQESKTMDNLKLQADIATQMTTITKAMSKFNMNAKQMGLTNDDIKAAMDTVKLGREANARLKGADLLAENNKIKEQQKPGLGMIS